MYQAVKGKPMQRTPPRPSPPKARQEERSFDKDLDDLCNTLERSRKRHLSVGLLRGDQVHDRLRQQEASASPLLKKSKTSLPPRLTPPAEEDNGQHKGGMAMTLADFRAHMRDNTDKNIADIKTVIGKVEVTVAEHTAKLDRHEATIRANQAQIAEMRMEMRTTKENATTQ